jgi:DNA polymerase III epsilon subunit family exonuclease
MPRPLVVVDTETATLQGAPHVLEIGAVRVVDGEIQDSFERYLRPEVAIEPEATAIHGITEEDIRDADDPATVLGDFFDWAGEDWFAAHNAPFDAKVIAFEARRQGFDELPPGLFLDSLLLARRFIPESPDHKLITLCEHLDLEDGPHHRALSDAVYCWKVLEECWERAGGLAEVSMTELLTKSGRPLTFQSAAPDTPRFPRRIRALSASLGTGDEVRLLYGTSAELPATLSVLPRFAYRRRDKDYLEAECCRSGILKTYRLDRVQKILS